MPSPRIFLDFSTRPPAGAGMYCGYHIGLNVEPGTITTIPRRKHEQAAEAEAAAGLPQPSGGKKDYTDEVGKVVTTFAQFGHKLHLLVDVKHEVALVYQVTTANAADAQALPALVEEALGKLRLGPIQKALAQRVVR